MNRREWCREYYYKQIANGWCPSCMGEIVNHKYVYCLKCRRRRAKNIARIRKELKRESQRLHAKDVRDNSNDSST